jgi:hypothetical protein
MLRISLILSVSLNRLQQPSNRKRAAAAAVKHADLTASCVLPQILQIEVHPDLADVLKAYAKAVIRQQPQNLVEFSAK